MDSPAGDNQSLQYNDSGNFGGTGIYYTSGSPTQTLATPDAPSFSDADADGVELLVGNGDGTGAGGGLIFTSGTGGDTGNGGDINITAGNGGTTSGTPGSINITAGSTNDNDTNGADIILQPGLATEMGSGQDGNIVLNGGIIVKGPMSFDPTDSFDIGSGNGPLMPRNIYMSARIQQYNGKELHGWSFPAIVSVGRNAGLTAAKSEVFNHSVGTPEGTDGSSFTVSAYVLVTASTTNNFSVTCDYTDENNVGHTLTMPFYQASGNLVTAITNITGTGPYVGMPLQFHAKNGTVITVNTVGTFTSVTYSVEAVLREIVTYF